MRDQPLFRESASQIDATRAQVQAAFEVLAQTLEATNRAFATVSAQTARLNGLMAQFNDTGAAGERLRDSCAEAARLLDHEARQIAGDGLGQALGAAMSSIEGITRETRQLAVVSTMTRIAGEGIGIPEIIGFVETLRQMTQQLCAKCEALDRGIRAIAAAEAAARGSLRTAAAQADAALQRARERAAWRAELQQRHGALVRTLEALAHQLAGTERTEIGTLVSGIQFADELAQRLEHAQAILADTRAAPQACARLAAAQIAVMGRDAEAVLARLRRSLAQMREVGQATADALVSDLGAEVEALLTALGDELDSSARLEATLGPALVVSVEADAETRACVARAHADFRKLQDIERSMTLAAVNAGLLAGRRGSAKAAMDVLSRAVQESGMACSGHTAGCHDAFLRVDTILGGSRIAELKGAAAELKRLVSLGQGQHASVAAGFAGLTETRARAADAAQGLDQAVAKALAALDGLPDPLARLAELGRGLAAAPDPDPGQLAGLNHLCALYTMQSERKVHAELCGDTAASVPPQVQSIEDILF